jgi:ubiquinone/menaquinone biosynthesis C-methylase UbiE
MSYEERLWLSSLSEEAKKSPYWGEHMARYIWALPYVKNKRVLDVACGTGYGSRTLGQVAKSVVGVDISEICIQKAREEYPEGLFYISDAEKLPFEDASFDVAISFETIEHLRDRKKFLLEIHRILCKEGLLILSTPNALYTEPINGVPKNPYHFYEYKPEELVEEVEPHYYLQLLLAQRISKRYDISPFWEDQKRLPKDLITQSKLLMWKIVNKFPSSFREKVSNLFWKRPFYPTAYDYDFISEDINNSPTLIIVCKKKDI